MSVSVHAESEAARIRDQMLSHELPIKPSGPRSANKLSWRRRATQQWVSRQVACAHR
eukprot:COSAG06_NODE_56215_length_286_cov_0.278075_1_plen_56_part_01